MLLLCLFWAGTATAGEPCTKTFVAGATNANASWHVDENWLPTGVPGPADVVCIFEDGDYQVLVDQPVTIAGLQIDASSGSPRVKILGTDFTLNGPAFLAGTTKLKVNDGAVLRTDGGGAIEVHSKLVIDGGTVEIDVDLFGHLNFAGSGSLTGGLVSHPGSVIGYENTGADAHLVIAEGFDNHGEVIFVGSVAMTLEVTSGSLVNTADGVISSKGAVGPSAGIPELRADLVNHGLIDVDGLDLKLVRDGSQHRNEADGVIQVAGADLEIDLGGGTDVPSNFTNYGTTTVGGGGTIRVFGSTGFTDVPSNFTNYGTATVGGGGSIRVYGNSGEGSSIALVNFGAIEIEAAGILALTDAVFDNPSSGLVSGSGTLDLAAAAAVIFDGTLSPGQSPGILTVDGELPEGPNAAIIIEIGGEAPGSNLDRLDVSGTLSADGLLDVSLLGVYHPLGGEHFEVLTYGDLIGWFGKIALPPLQHLLSWNIAAGPNALALEVVCEGTQLSVDQAPDRNPVSIGYEFIYQVSVDNRSSVAATDVVVTGALPAEFVFRPDLSSPECLLIGSTVECSLGALASGALWTPSIAVEPAAAGLYETTVFVGAWECDTDDADNQAPASVDVVAAEPCDANYDLGVDSDDLVPAVGHIFGAPAAGNPDCRLGNGITADDLAAIIEASH